MVSAPRSSVEGGSVCGGVGLDGGKIPAGACAYGICRRLWSLPSAGGTGEVTPEVEIRRVDPLLTVREFPVGGGSTATQGLVLCATTRRGGRSVLSG